MYIDGAKWVMGNTLSITCYGDLLINLDYTDMTTKLKLCVSTVFRQIPNLATSITTCIQRTEQVIVCRSYLVFIILMCIT